MFDVNEIKNIRYSGLAMLFASYFFWDLDFKRGIENPSFGFILAFVGFVVFVGGSLIKKNYR